METEVYEVYEYIKGVGYCTLLLLVGDVRRTLDGPISSV